MKDIRTDIMGMPITVDIAEPFASEEDLKNVFDYFIKIDQRFSPFKPDSEVERINRGELSEKDYSPDMKTVLKLSQETKEETNGYFDVFRDGKLNPSGLVKGWAIWQAANSLRIAGFNNFYINAGGDIQANGNNGLGKPWRIGITSPFNVNEVVKVVFLSDKGIATSGIYERGDHIYNPHQKEKEYDGLLSFTVIGPDVYEADRFATAAFAMGKKGVKFIENQPGLEAYAVYNSGDAFKTSGFSKYEHA